MATRVLKVSTLPHSTLHWLSVHYLVLKTEKRFSTKYLGDCIREHVPSRPISSSSAGLLMILKVNRKEVVKRILASMYVGSETPYQAILERNSEYLQKTC